MSRAADIITEFTRYREFAYPHSAEELLAMAYDAMEGRARRAEADAAEARRQRDSTIHQRAAELYDGRDLSMLSPTDFDPTRWKLALEPFRLETKMLSESPASWDPNILDEIIRTFRDLVTHRVAEKLYEMRENAKSETV